MKSDPTDTGGLFVGRRPGTKPVKYRDTPEYAGERRQKIDRTMAALTLAALIFVALLFWGPLPLAWLWIGSRVDYWTGSTFLGITVAFFGLLLTLMAGLMVMRRLDILWILLRRAAGTDQRDGVMGRVFAVTAVVGATLFTIWLLVIQGPGASLAPTG
ncbi:MAG: hypothetical protein ACR2NH_06825 [Solirubrobacteraceae bacterium]